MANAEGLIDERNAAESNWGASAIPKQSEFQEDVRGLLLTLVRSVANGRDKRLVRVIDGSLPLNSLPADGYRTGLQAIGIWFQLLAIASEIVGMRSRRALERAGSADAVIGSFSNVVGEIAWAGYSAEQLMAALGRLDVDPTMTAHPTETKRVTVLESHLPDPGRHLGAKRQFLG
jgi:phosphoenolpyruvate carboxylase